MPRDPATGARARARAELTDAIKATARQHLADAGAAALSLRAVARDLGMVSSAVYRYFPSRDELLTALIVDAYDAVGAAAEAAVAAAPEPADVVDRWRRCGAAIRSWALANPHEYALVYGSPVPGYAAPAATIAPAGRVALVFLGLLADGVAAGQVDVEDRIETSRAIRSDLARLRDEAAPGVPDAVLARGLLVWTQLFGAISFELFGHLHGVISDDDALFDLLLRRTADYLTRGPR
jgi:AcrR family transcriptional regulator